MSFLIVGDIHLDLYPDFGIHPSGLTNRLYDMKIGLEGYLSKAIELKCTHIVFTGDIFDNRSQIPSDCIQVWGNFLKDCHDSNMPVVVVQGNHDQYAEGRSSLAGFLGMTLIDSQKPIKLGRLKVFCIPYNKSVEAVRAGIKKACDLRADYIIGHFGLGDVELQKGFCEKDVAFSTDIPAHAPMVVIGHYHNYQKIGRYIFYIGTPVGKTFAEANHPKYVLHAIGKRDIHHHRVDWVKQLREVELNTGDELKLDVANFYYKLKVSESYKVPVNSSIVKVQVVKENDLIKSINENIKQTNKQIALDYIENNPPERFTEDILKISDKIMREVI